jgi:hypothetical protein
MDSLILEFYRLHRPDSEGRMLEKIWQWDRERLEECHDFIQWMFPLDEPSSVNPDAPLLTKADRAAFDGNPALRAAMRRSLVVFLDFLGLELCGDGRVEKAAHFDERIALWKYTNHNWLRITRMLKSLRLVGLEAEAQQAWRCLRQLHDEDGYVSAHSFHYWQTAIDGPMPS